MNSITISGIIKGEEHKGFRKLEFKISDYVSNGYISCVYWTRNNESVFNQVQINTHLIIKGHLDYNQEFGIHLVVEEFEKLKPYENLTVH